MRIKHFHALSEQMHFLEEREFFFSPILVWEFLSRILTITHMCRSFGPGNCECIGVNLAVVSLNPEHRFAQNLQLDQFLDMIDNRLFAAVALLGKVTKTDAGNTVDTRAVGDFLCGM